MLLTFSVKPQMRDRIKQASEAAKGLSRDNYPKFFSRVFYETSMVMYNIDLCYKYLEEKANDKMEVILENRTVYSLEEYLIQLKNALSKQKKNIWQTIQKKVSKLFIKSQICEFSYPDLIAFLEHCNAFIEIGQDFSNSSSKM